MSDADSVDVAEQRLYRVEEIAGLTLRIGVVISIAIILLGIIISISLPDSPMRSSNDYHELVASSMEFPHTVGGIFHGLGQFQGRAFVSLGIALLILTPILRVAISLVGFSIQKDRAFIWITLVVLLLLLLSLTLGRVERHG